MMDEVSDEIPFFGVNPWFWPAAEGLEFVASMQGRPHIAEGTLIFSCLVMSAKIYIN
jgi:hypothetical protein